MMKKSSLPILSLVSLQIGFISGRKKIPLLYPITVNASEGELIAVIGRNGIGKSTLMRTITGLQPALGGEVLFSGSGIHRFTKAGLAEKIGFISTEVVKASGMTVYDLVALGRFPYTNWIGKIEEDDEMIIADAIGKTGISHLIQRNISELSDGERQRAMIARVLAQDTGIIIMDEPTAFLDIKSKFEIVHLMHELAKLKGKTVIFSTHDLNIAIDQADKIWLLLSEGIKEGAPEDLMLSGSFNELFGSGIVKFNSSDGSFSFIKEERGSVHIEGKGSGKYWTAKAMSRLGFRLADAGCGTVIRVPDNGNRLWILNRNGIISEFSSIQALVEGLNEEWIS
jgi:iron complex transport system ATP-binding protein